MNTLIPQALQTHWRRLSAMYAAAPINAQIPSRVTISEGRAQLEAEISPAFWHATGAVDGSMYFKGLADAALLAASSRVPEAVVLTAHFEVQLLGPVAGASLRAVGICVARDGRKLRSRAELYAQDRLIARGQGVFVVSDRPIDDVPAYRDAR